MPENNSTVAPPPPPPPPPPLPTTATEPRKKRAKIMSACGECRRKKTKCNGEQPCRNCQKSNAACIYLTAAQLDDKRNHGPSKAALEAIEDRLKAIEDMLRTILQSQLPVHELLDSVAVNNFLNKSSGEPHMNRLPSIHDLSATLPSTSTASPFHNTNSAPPPTMLNDNSTKHHLPSPISLIQNEEYHHRPHSTLYQTNENPMLLQQQQPQQQQQQTNAFSPMKKRKR